MPKLPSLPKAGPRKRSAGSRIGLVSPTTSAGRGVGSMYPNAKNAKKANAVKTAKKLHSSFAKKR